MIMNKITIVILLLIVGAVMLFRVLAYCVLQQTRETCISAAAVDILLSIVAVGLVVNLAIYIIKEKE